MKRLKGFFAGLATVLLLAIGLGLWIALPWFAVLALVAAIALWLFTTRSGRLAREATKIGIAGLPQRWGASSVIVIGIAGVVAVLVAMLAMGEGFKATLDRTGDASTAILLRAGSQAETNSVITRDQAPLLAALPGIARGADGKALASPELSQVVNLPSKADGTDANVQFRGVGPAGWAIRPQLKLVEGRRFTPGLREIVVGKGVQRQFRGLEVGKQLKLANQLWTVVGVFESKDSHDSELWTDADVLGPAYQRSAFQSVTVKLDGKAGFQQLKAALAADPRLKLDASTTRDYYGKQSEGLTKLIRILGTVIGAIMAIGAVFGALNSMYAAVAGRAREIATLRALGFRSVPVVTAVMLETMLLALLGGVLGAAVGNHQGAGIGAASGAIVGTGVAGPSTAYSQGMIQYQYNNAYTQCMYARGNQVPGFTR